MNFREEKNAEKKRKKLVHNLLYLVRAGRFSERRKGGGETLSCSCLEARSSEVLASVQCSLDRHHAASAGIKSVCFGDIRPIKNFG